MSASPLAMARDRGGDLRALEIDPIRCCCSMRPPTLCSAVCVSTVRGGLASRRCVRPCSATRWPPAELPGIQRTEYLRAKAIQPLKCASVPLWLVHVMYRFEWYLLLFFQANLCWSGNQRACEMVFSSRSQRNHVVEGERSRLSRQLAKVDIYVWGGRCFVVLWVFSFERERKKSCSCQPRACWLQMRRAREAASRYCSVRPSCSSFVQRVPTHAHQSLGHGSANLDLPAAHACKDLRASIFLRLFGNLQLAVAVCLLGRPTLLREQVWLGGLSPFLALNSKQRETTGRGSDLFVPNPVLLPASKRTIRSVESQERWFQRKCACRLGSF